MFEFIDRLSEVETEFEPVEEIDFDEEDGFYYEDGDDCDSDAYEQREKAEEKLDVCFADDFSEFLSKYGSLTSKELIIAGISNKKSRSVVTLTKDARRDYDIAEGVYVAAVFEDGRTLLQDGDGAVYFVNEERGVVEYVCDDLFDYIDNEV